MGVAHAILLKNYKQILKIKILFINKNKIIKFMNDYKLLKVPDNIDAIIDIYKQIDSEYLDSSKFLSMNVVNDLSTVIIGNDTTDYDGNPNDHG